VFSHLPEVTAVLCLCPVFYRQMSCPLFNDHDSQVVQKGHCGSAVQWRWQTAAGTHQGFGALFSVDHGILRPDAGPQISPQLRL
jgi:hypothetical protein